jgi:ATP-dependent Clp protease protease subunit
MKSNHKVFELFHETNCLITKRLVYFGSENYDEDNCGESGVDFLSTKKLIKNLIYLDTLSSKNIKLYFNSPGGDWHHGMAIYDCILGLRSKVVFVGFGYVRSMGSIIMQACDKRLLTPNCKVMIHDGIEGYYGIPKSFEAWGKESRKTRQKMYEIYYNEMIKKDKNITLKKIEDMCKHDYIFSGEDAVNMGLADRVLK